MRKIDKSKILAIEYAEWVANLDKNNRDHPKYYSSHKYYKDVLVSLLYCQKGLCAYTETFIASEERYGPHNFINGRYIIPSSKSKKENSFSAQLEHFDHSLKATQGWSWENFFAVSDKVNTSKLGASVDEILKPDLPDYDPYNLLAYNRKEGLFYANPKIKDEQLAEKIEAEILTLGLNLETVKDLRKEYLEPKWERLKRGQDIEPVFQYFTAFEMIRQQLFPEDTQLSTET
jgi:hypothetical protein